MDSILQGIPRIFCYIDDILITGTDDQDHLKNLSEVLSWFEYQSIKLKKVKCRFLAESQKQNLVPEVVTPEDWLYSMPIQDECDVSQSDTTTNTVPNRYPVQTRQAFQRLIEQTDI